MKTRKFNELLSRYKLLLDNFNYLSILQLFQLLFPLIIYPYLIRVLGKDLYGVVAYANAITAYFIVFINFGFEISEIREISIHRKNKRKVSEIVSSVLSIKSIFALLSILIIVLSVFFIPKLSKHRLLFFATFGMLIDAAINPRFFFQGIEKMKFITILSLGSRLMFLSLIFIFVKTPEHYFLVPLLTSIGAIISSIFGLIIVFKEFDIRYLKPKLSKIREYVNNSLPFFGSRISILLINKTNILLIGTFVGYTEVAYYDLADKLVSVMKMPLNIFNQVLYPNVSKTKNTKLVKKIMFFLFLVYIIGYLSMFYLGVPLIEIFAGSEMIPAVFVLYILGFSVITELFSVFMGAPMLLAIGYKKEYNRSIIWGSIFYLIVLLLIYIIGIVSLYSLTTATVLSSAFIFLYRFFYCRKFKLL